MKSRYLLLCALLAVAAAAACVDTLEPDVGELTAGNCENEDSDPDTDVDPNAVLMKLQMGCACHNPTASAISIDSTGFSVGSFGSIKRGGNNSRDKIVVAGDPCGSYLYQKLSDAPPTGARMPPSGPYFSRSDMALLHDWIAEGADAQ
ncbi:MAG TPA: hypothetical protein VFX59_11650 [Polyangiales bacterium]|nr:hypothetical protein [Polyangiales bacterium]